MKLAEIKEQLDDLERQITEKVRMVEANETSVMNHERFLLDRKLARLELTNAREKMKQYYVS